MTLGLLGLAAVLLELRMAWRRLPVPPSAFVADGEGREELTGFQRLERGPSAKIQAAAEAGGCGLWGSLRG